MEANKSLLWQSQRGRLTAAGLLMALSVAAGVFPVLLVMKVFMEIMSLAPNQSGINLYLALIFMFLAMKAIFYGLSLAYSHIAAYYVLADIRMLIIRHLRKLNLGFFQTQRAGGLTKIINHDVEQVELYLAHALPDLFATVSVPVVILATVCVVDWRLAVSMIALMPLAFVNIALLSGVWKKMTVAYSRSLAEMSSSLMEFIATIPVIKAFSKEENRTGSLRGAMAEYRKWATRQIIFSAAPVGVLGIFIEGGLAVMAVVGSTLLMRGSVSVEQFLTAVILGIPFYGALARLFFIGSTSVLYDNSIKNINSIMTVEPPRTGDSAVPVKNFAIEFKDVTFSYKEGEEVLKEISFTIPPHTVTAIVGKSGSGKSTLANLLMRFWFPQAGQITIGGHDIREMKEEVLSNLISMVHQDVYLFNTTIAENIRLGRQDADDRQVYEAAEMARMHDIVQTMPEGYQTVVGEKGARLSGGQKQRISIARAILKNAPIIILDEATASIDPYNEKLIHQAISNLTQDKTLIVIAHHLHTITGADQILLLDEGRIAAAGRHEELLESSLLYRQMWRDQEQINHWGIKEAAQCAN